MRLQINAGVLAVIVLVIGAGATVRAQQVPDLEGGWTRLDLSGGGSYSGIDEMFPKAVLTPAALAQIPPPPPPQFSFAENGRPHEAGEAYIVTAGRCGGGGFGGVDVNSAAFFIVQTKDEVLITRENPSGRHIYMDGRKHPDPSRWSPTVGGHSVGRYQNGQMIVDTVGFTTGRVQFGKGWRTPETHLEERFKLSPDAHRLTVTYTWTDPKIYVKPHVYDISFDRQPQGSYAFEDWCDSGDPKQRQSIVPPKQLP